MTTLVCSAFVLIPVGTLVQAVMTMPKKGKIVGVSLSATVRGSSTESYLVSSLSMSGDTTNVVVPVAGVPALSNSVLAALIGYSLPPATGGDGVNLNQYFLMEVEVAANQSLYFNTFGAGAEARAWALVYLR